MPNRGKVINGLEDIQKHLDTGYSFAICWKSELIRDALALLKEQEEREKAICKEICDFIRGACSTDTDDDKDFVCYEIQKCFIQCGRSVK